MAILKIKKNFLYAYLALTFSFMGGCAIFQGPIGSFQWRFFYYGSPLVLLALSMYYIYKNRNIEIIKNRNFFIRLFCVPRLIMLLYSCFIWLITATSFPYISRGISNTLFQCTAYICGVCIACGEKDDILDITTLSAITVFVISYIIGFLQNGFYFIYAFNPFNDIADSFRKYTELHELSYIVGLCILMNLIIGKNTSLKKKKFLFWISLLVFITSWKRIGIFAVLTTYLYYGLFSKSKTKNKSVFVRLTGVIGTIISILFVSMVVSGKLDILLKSFGIGMMGRDIIYAYFRKFAYFSPSYVGKGLGFVSRQFDYITVYDLYNMSSIRALHNDYFKMYIELGFIGFVFWCVWWLISIPQIIQKRYGIKKAFICLLFILFEYILFTTDNTESYTNFQMVLSSIITYFAMFYLEHSENKLQNDYVTLY